ncbi:response regulator transcription factor [Streptomyces sp. NPDC057743]|uniref:response regulator transcription factor n=1 Tax=Streptomyces sp. NPDC057743 TaxID=3346236 RepID=UPI003685B04B
MSSVTLRLDGTDDDGNPEERRPPATQLTRREAEVAQGIPAGLSNRGIGRRLGISERTVKVHVRSIFIKMDVSSRTEAAVRALREGHIPMPPAAPDEV